MAVSFCVLGSGSRGNASLLRTSCQQVLIDAGFSPNELESRLKGIGSSWDSLSAVVLTHTHTDHLYRRCLSKLLEHRIPLFCAPGHAKQLSRNRFFKRLQQASLVITFDRQESFQVGEDFHFHPLHLSHDCPPTFGFRIEAKDRLVVRRVAYLADLGHWTTELIDRICDVDLLALEFNHDEEMEHKSRRPATLIERVLGPKGHLSNHQAATAFEQVLKTSTTGGPKRLVQLHLSEECNDRKLAYSAAREVAIRHGAHTEIFSSHQQFAGTIHDID
jgi:phosphoribosyl 1,2-cyclic phosphodiesterase